MKSMNDIERKMAEIAQRLKRYGLCGARASFEDEGISHIQLARLKEVVACAGLPLFLKIGGAENLTGVYDGLTVGVEEMIAPMIESRFALQKFLHMVQKEIAEDNRRGMEFGFNLETITGVQNFDAMLSLPDLKVLALVNIGRVDLTGSMDLDRSAINSEQVSAVCTEVFAKAKKAGLKTSLGGGIDAEALPFIQRLDKAELLDRFETRRLVFRANAWSFGLPVIRGALKFEYLYLSSLQRFGSRIQARDKTRLAMIEGRLGEEGQELVTWAKGIVARVTS